MARALISKTRNRSSKATARIVHSRAVQQEREAQGEATAYRRGMRALSKQVNRVARTAKPEQRRKLAEAKDELRRLTGNEPRNPKGAGAPGRRYNIKEKAKSRRNPTQPRHAPNKPRR